MTQYRVDTTYPRVCKNGHKIRDHRDDFHHGQDHPQCKRCRMRTQGLYYARFALRRWLNDTGRSWPTAVSIQEATEEAWDVFVEVGGEEAMRAGAAAYRAALKARRVPMKDAPKWEPVLYGIVAE